MHRFYTLSQNICGNKIVISDKAEVHYLRDVLRLKPNDEVILFDEQGNEYNSSLEVLSHKVVLNIQERRLFCAVKQRNRISVTCAVAMPKKSKMDDIVDKLTQLGVERIIPLKTERVIAKLDRDKEVSRLARWRKLAQAAAEQSQRQKLPIIEPIKDLKELLAQAKALYDLKLISTLVDSKRKSLKEIFKGLKPKNVLVLIGPEGDFSPGEVDLAKKSGCIPVSLGDLVLRVETAAVAVASILNYELHTNYHEF
jgi:16S rRNA (uracil1498-N3)-methyltransferase